MRLKAIARAERPDIVMGWMNNWNYAASIPTTPWRGGMALPRELSLVAEGMPVADTGERRLSLVQRPVREFEAVVAGAGGRLRPFDLEGRRPLTAAVHYRLDVEFEVGDASHVGLDLLVGDGEVTTLDYDVAAGELSLDRTRSGDVDFDPLFASIETAPLSLDNGRLSIVVVVDRTSVEVFAQGGRVCLTDQVFAAAQSTMAVLTARGGIARVTSCELVPIQAFAR